MQALLRVMIDAKQIGGLAFDPSVGYEVAQELCAEGVKVLDSLGLQTRNPSLC